MVLKIEDLGKPKGLKRAGKRKGRGVGSGKGKTCGRGHKGAKSRSGGGKYTPGFEGGQMPLVRRLPKRGFNNKFRKPWSTVNIGVLQENTKITPGSTVDKAFLNDLGIVKNKKWPVKLLAKGELNKKLTVKLDAFSESAKAAVEAAGGKVEKIG